MDPALRKTLDELPPEPGCYLMKDRGGEVVYVGKAASLRSRVRQYFDAGGGDDRIFIPLLDDLLGDVEVIVTRSEKEAVLLENELIKKHKPRFNVRLRDDKDFIVLRLDEAHPYPRLEVRRAREKRRPGARYFGPYSSASAIRETLRIINRHFQLRTCSDHVLANRRRPCLLYQIGRCPAPCCYEVAQEQYRKSVDEVLLFLEGRAGELERALRDRMKQASAEQRFEDAARIRDQLFAIERSLERQNVAVGEEIDQDAFALYREADRLLLYVLYVRHGRITGGQSFLLTGQEVPDEELLASFVNLYYGQDNFVPKEVLLPLEPE